MAISSVKATINGAEYVLTLNPSSGMYEATITAPSKSSFNETGGFYGVSLTAYDDSGNYTTVTPSTPTLGDDLKLVVKEKVAPTITMTSPAKDAVLTTNLPTFSFTCEDADSGVKKSTIKLFIDGTEVSGVTASGTDASYVCSYVPTSAIANGAHTWYVTCEDNDGNVKTSDTYDLTVDTVAPTLNVTSPTDNLKTNVNKVTVSGTTNDATSSPVTLTVNGSPVSVNVDGSFSTEVTLTSGANTITIIAEDGAGLKTTVTRTVTYDTSAPVFNSISIVPNPVDAGKTFVISVDVTD